MMLIAAMACQEASRPKRDPCPKVVSALLGARAWEKDGEGLRAVIDARALPRIVTAPSAAVMGFVWERDTSRILLSTQADPRPKDQVHRLRALPDGTGIGWLRFEADRRVCASWPARVTTAPEDEPQLRPIAALRGAQKFEQARARAEEVASPGDELQLWLSVEKARIVQASEGEAAAIEVWKDAAAAADTLGVPSEVSRRLRAAAFLAVRARRFQEAFPLIDRARTIDEAIHNEAGLVQLAYTESLLAQSEEIRSFWRAGRLLEQAIERGEALAMPEVLDYREALAILYSYEGRNALALEMIAGVRAARGTKEERSARELLNESFILLAAMRAGAIPKDWDKARASYQEALAALPERGSPNIRANIYQKLAWIALESGDLAVCQNWLDRFYALPQHRSTYVFPQCRLVEAGLSFSRGRFADAAKKYRQIASEEGADSPFPSEWSWRALAGLARAEEALGHTEAAKSAYAGAIDLLGRKMAALPMLEARAQSIAEHEALIDDAVDLYLRIGDTEAVLGLLERKQQWVLNLLVAGTVALQTRDPDRLKAYELALAKVIEADEGRRSASPREVAAIEVELDRARRAASERLAELLASRQRSRDFEEIPGSAELRAALSPGQAMIFFAAHRGAILGLFLDARGLSVETIDPRLRGSWLSKLEDVDHLFVIGAGVDTSSISALPIPGGDTLIERTGWSELAYAAQLLRFSSDPATGPPAVFANPDSTLRGAREEGRYLQKKWPDAKVFFGDEVTAKGFVEALGTASLVHYAGHLDIPDTETWNIALRLHGEATVRLGDILLGQVRSRLVFLSGCRASHEVALGGGSAVSLAAIVSIAGARSVIGTDREIEDEVALRFAKRFYEEDGDRNPAPAFQRVIAEFMADSEMREIAPSFKLYGAP